MEKTELNVTALVRLLHHVENVAETRLSGTVGTMPDAATAASWLTLINASLRAAVLETERATRRLETRRAYDSNGTYRNNLITV
jgi:hypothetical protein